jgi:phenylacetate-CoA ligase
VHGGGYHINSDYGLLEFANLKPSAKGDSMIGDALGTSLYNLAMPLVRYDMEDGIELFTDPTASCPCGRTFPLIKAIHGRSDDIIVTPDGRFIISLFTLPELVTGIDFVQFIQESPLKLHVNVIPGKMWNDEQQEKLAFCIEDLVGSEMKVSIRSVDHDDIIADASGKIRPVISHVDWMALV